MSERKSVSQTVRNRGSLRAAVNLESPVPMSAATEWTRNPLWLTLPSFTDGEQKIAGLFAVRNSDYGYASFKMAGNYTVNWGDGNTENFSTGTTCTHAYTYGNSALDDTDRPVTFTVSSSTVTRAAHNLPNGTVVKFYSLTNTTGLDEGCGYYVINATTNTFQVSGDPNGTALTFGGSDGSATLLPYKQAIITITPQAGANLTSADFQTTTPPSGVSSTPLYGQAWLDLTLSGNNFTSLVMGSADQPKYFPLLEQIQFLMSTIATTSWGSKFASMRALARVPYVPLPTASGAVDASYLFYDCGCLKTAPIMNTSAVTNATFMFSKARLLLTIPRYNFSAVTNGSSLFRLCYSLQWAPQLNLSACTNASQMFQYCYALRRIDGLITTPLLTNISSMFYYCNALEESPMFNTSGVTNATNFFQTAESLRAVPQYDLSSCTNPTSLFNLCSSLREIPRLQFSKLNTSIDSTFNGTSLSALPLLDTANTTTIAYGIQSMPFLREIPAWNVSAVTASPTLGGLNSLTRVKWTGLKVTHDWSSARALSKTALEEIFTNLGTPATRQTITITNNGGVDTAVSKTSCGTTSGSNTVTQSNTTSLVTGMLVTGTGISDNVAVTFQDTGDTVTRTAHGLSNTQIVSFDTITSTTGISLYTRYYVVNAATDTFQVSTTVNGAAVPLTTDGSGTMLYGSYITGISANTNFTLDKPASATGTVTLTARKLDSSIATMKNWAVTF